MGGAGGCYREADVVVTSSFAPSSTARTATDFHLNGFAQLQNIELQWVHTDSRPKRYFVLEKSMDGQVFKPIQIVKSEDVEHRVATYQKVDEQPQIGYNYYRIGTAFSTGYFTYSEIIKVDFSPIEPFGLYPNPVNYQGELFLNLSDLAGQSVDLIIFNGLGQPVQRKRIDKIDNNPIGIKLESLEDGVYSISVKVQGKRLQAKQFIVQRL